MGGWKRTDPTTYLVTWPDDLVIKAGYSERQRWRRFVLRGAEIAHLTSSPNFALATGIEGELHDWLRQNVDRAFDSKEESESHMGSGGGGYLECYRATDEIQFAHAVASCSRIMRSHSDPEKFTHMHGRTDGRTNGEITHVSHKSSRSDTCAQVQDSADVNSKHTTQEEACR